MDRFQQLGTGHSLALDLSLDPREVPSPFIDKPAPAFSLAQLHTGTVALGIRHVLCTPLRLVRYVERADQRGAEKISSEMSLILCQHARSRPAVVTA